MRKNFFKKVFCPCIMILSLLLPMSLKVNAATSAGSFGAGVGANPSKCPICRYGRLGNQTRLLCR